MKVFLYWLISLTIPLMMSSLASADTIIFKDGKKVHVGRTWKEDGQVKWATSGITIGYPEEDVERVEKTPNEEDPIGNQPNPKKNIHKETTPPAQTVSKSELQSKGVRIGDGIVCNKFKLVTKVTGSTLDLLVDTDLPENTIVMISVSRSYLEKVNTDADINTRVENNFFLHRYSSSKSKVPVSLSVTSANWISVSN